MLWATFALLGGALENSQTVGADDGRAAVSAGVGICAITMACAATVAAERIRPLLRRLFKSRPLRLLARWSRRLVAYHGAYHRPPPLPPSLARLQILRT
jgi:peptidoglycan/LPS O-acetylase OafA/YrhL